MEVRDEAGQLIATIHDLKAFLNLMDVFEQHVRMYRCWGLPVKRMNVLVNLARVEEIKHAANELQKIRTQLGDERTNLYPVDLPEQG